MSAEAGVGGTGVMAPAGYYAAHNATQGSASRLGLDLVADAVREVPASAPGEPWRIADLGCAQGRNSMAPMGAALAALGARPEAPRDVEVVHTDLPGNDWATFFRTLTDDPASYLRTEPRAYASVVGRSFYERVLPRGTLSLAWSASTLHWLSASPGPIVDHFFVALSTDEDAVTRYRAQSRRDWRAFLDARALELRVGGSVVLVDVLMGDDGRMGSEALFQVLEDALRAQRDAGALHEDEYRAVAYPTWFRSLAELREPFTPGYAGPEGSRLELVSLTPVDLPDPFAAVLAGGDARAYAAQQVGFLRGFLEPSFRVALADRSPEQRAAVLDAVFTAAEERVAADPAAVSPDYRLVTGRVRRTA